jgi:hypothetical protein
MSNFKPSCLVGKETRTFKTYTELKKNIPTMFKEQVEEHRQLELHVSRSKRGEWGEWFEVWKLNHSTNKLYIDRQGWM